MRSSDSRKVVLSFQTLLSACRILKAIGAGEEVRSGLRDYHGRSGLLTKHGSGRPVRAPSLPRYI